MALRARPVDRSSFGFLMLLGLWTMVSAALICLQACSHAPPPPVPSKAGDGLIGLLLFGAEGQIQLQAYPANVRGELQAYLERYAAFDPGRFLPSRRRTGKSEAADAARAAYERRMAAVSADLRAPELARKYVEDLQPCYQWQGRHECPEREANFAAGYLQANPDTPFGDYLRLLAAHRRLCAAEAYEAEKLAEGAARSREVYARSIEIALRTKSPMLAMAAQRLEQRNTCLSKE